MTVEDLVDVVRDDAEDARFKTPAIFPIDSSPSEPQVCASLWCSASEIAEPRSLSELKISLLVFVSLAVNFEIESRMQKLRNYVIIAVNRHFSSVFRAPRRPRLVARCSSRL